MKNEGLGRQLPDWPAQAHRGHKIEGYRYRSREFFELEWEHMWTKVWLLLGRESEIPEPGDWQKEDVGPESIIMVRQQDRSIKAFYNVCQHRGNRLVSDEKGSVNRFVCKYHSWAFRPDGVLDFVPDAEDFPEGNPCGKLSLHEIPCESFAGFIWVNMDPNPVDLKTFLGPIWSDWQRYEIDKWKRYVALTATLPCNWKVVLDNFNESYHVPTVHRPPSSPSDSKRADSRRTHTGIDTRYQNTRFDLSDEGHNRMIMPGGYAGTGMDEVGEIYEPLASILREWELDPADFTGRGRESRRALQQAKRKIGLSRGYTHYEKMADEQFTDAFHYTLFPNFAVSIWSDGFHFLRARPHPTDPEQCIFDNWWYASQPAGEVAPVRTTMGTLDRGAEVEHQVFKYGDQSLGLVIDQDTAIFSQQQMGFRSRGFKGVYLSGQESRVRRFHEVIDDYIDGTRTAKNNKRVQ